MSTAARRDPAHITKAISAYADATENAASKIEHVQPPLGVDEAQAAYVAALRSAVPRLRKFAAATTAGNIDAVATLGQRADGAVRRAGRKLQSLWNELSSVHAG